jgi:oxygen-independent coproporphyrinogen-3 oxidase
VSFGFQTANDELLEKIGRLHDAGRFFAAYREARAAGFKNINVDLIFGFAGQSPADWEKTLGEVIAIKPEHISTYALKIEANTKMGKENVAVDPDAQADMYLRASEILLEAGYQHYEISNFARPGLESKHNKRYWLNEETIGAGVSAAGYQGGRRRKNVTQLKTYFDALEEGRLPVAEIIELSPEDRAREDIMLALRLKEGVASSRLASLNVPALNQFKRAGLIRADAGRTTLTPQGWLLSNQLFQYFV